MKVTLSCMVCGEPFDGEGPPTFCPCGHPLEVRYEWEDKIPSREGTLPAPTSLWRYLPVLPPVDGKFITSLGEGWTPLIHAKDYPGVSLYFKDETVNPTGSFKDRGMAMAVSLLRSFGIQEVCLPSAGNAGAAAAAYCQEAGIACHVYFSETIPKAFIRNTETYGADVRLAGVTMTEAATAMQKENQDAWFDLSTFKEPYRAEGKKTLGYEILEQLDWQFPDVVIYPTGGGTGLIGMWKAFKEIKNLGWAEGKLPRMVSVQSNGCAPIVRAFAEGADESRPWGASYTIALGLNAARPFASRWILNVLRESGGIAVMVEEQKIGSAQDTVATLSETDPSPEAGVAWLGFETLVTSGWIKSGERVVIPITGSADSYA